MRPVPLRKAAIMCANKTMSISYLDKVSSLSELSYKLDCSISVEEEMVRVVNMVGCCTVDQLTNYFITMRDRAGNMIGGEITRKNIWDLICRLDRAGLIHLQIGSNLSNNDRLVYAKRFSKIREIHSGGIFYGKAKMATIIPFLPSSRSVYDIDEPMSFIFLYQGVQVEVAVIRKGSETAICSIMDRRSFATSVDKSAIRRIAVVAEESDAYNIIGGGFTSVCILDENNCLTQVRAISKELAWENYLG